MRFAHFSQIFPRAGETAAERYEQLWRELQLCDELGFDYAFASVHHFSHLRPQAAAFTVAAAERTQRLRVGPFGYSVALYDPIRIVEEVAVLDNLAHGRLEIGLTTGVTRDEFRIYGADWDNRAARAREALLLLRKAITSDLSADDEPADAPVADRLRSFDFQGEFSAYEDVRLSVRPLQVPHPPLWLISLDPVALELAAREGAHTGYLWISRKRSEAAPPLAEYLERWAHYGHEQPPKIVFETFVYVDETDAAAVERASQHLLSSVDEIYGGRFGGGGTALAAILEKMGHLGAAEIRRHMYDLDYLLGNDLFLVGSPEAVSAKLRAIAEEGRFNVIAAEFNIGSLPEEDLMRSIRLFGEHVIPALREFDPTRTASPA
jgi:alkanesulfonate monooxygenase SsuD/methylene tetrahydromethanopterin reductase-like flavin-dependent oxidoreductase (luciferase family)